MRKFGLLVAFAAAVLLPAALLTPAAMADGMPRHHHHAHHHHHHHHWGSGHWDIVRWADRDCKIWHDDDVAPWGEGWRVMSDNLDSYDEAWHELVHLQHHGKCL